MNRRTLCSKQNFRAQDESRTGSPAQFIVSCPLGVNKSSVSCWAGTVHGCFTEALQAQPKHASDGDDGDCWHTLAVALSFPWCRPFRCPALRQETGLTF